MHIAINGWFWNRPDTGSGQYVRRLVSTFADLTPRLRITLIVPGGWEVEPPGQTVSVSTVPLPGTGHRAKVRFEQRLFPQAAQQVGADLAHVPYWGSPLASPVPVVVTVHDLIPLILPQYRGGLLARVYTGLVAAAARGASAVITDSEASRQDILAHLAVPAERVHAIPLGAGTEFHPRRGSLVDMAVQKKHGLPPEFVLYVGGYDVRKNVQTLLKAYTYIRDGAGDLYPLVLAGRLPDRPSLRFTDVQGLIDQMNIRDVVQLTGWVDPAELPALYRLASCFVFPSRYEGFGLPVLEAMACGTPIVAANASSLPEIVGDAGFLVEPGDARRMAGAILAILNQPALAGDLARRAAARAGEYTWARTAAETLVVYEQASAGR
jgi:glycosyltransferase involved in cell wall biosynthesis